MLTQTCCFMNMLSLNQTQFLYRIEIWYSDVIINSVSIGLALYLLAALFHHQRKVEKRRNKTFIQLSLEGKYRVLTKCICIAIGLISLSGHLTSTALLTVEGFTVFSNNSNTSTISVEQACDFLRPVNRFALACSIALIYLFLWLRQNMLYIDSSLNFLSNKCVRIYSIAILVIFFSFEILSFGFYMFYAKTHSESGVCHFDLTNDLSWNESKILIARFAVDLVLQVALVSLFFHPLWKRSKWQIQQNSSRSNRLKRRLTKAFVLALIYILVDVSSFVVFTLLYKENSNNAESPFVLNLLLNHFFTIIHFEEWKKVLWPWKVNSRLKTTNFSEKRNQPSVVATAS